MFNNVFESLVINELPSGPDFVPPAHCPVCTIKSRKGFELALWTLEKTLPHSFKGQSVTLSRWRWRHHFDRGGIQALRSKIAGDLWKERRRILGPSVRELRDNRTRVMQEIAYWRVESALKAQHISTLERSLERLRAELAATHTRTDGMVEKLQHRIFDWEDDLGEAVSAYVGMGPADAARIETRNSLIARRIRKVQRYENQRSAYLNEKIETVRGALIDARYGNVEETIDELKKKLEKINNKIKERN